MITLTLLKQSENSSRYEEAHAFARAQYATPRMGMKLYYRPSVLIAATNLAGEIVGVVGANIGTVTNNMLLADRRTKHLMDRPDACEQSIFALHPEKITIAPITLTASIGLYSHSMGMKYIGVLAIPISRKIFRRMGVRTLRHETENIGFGLPDQSLLPESVRGQWNTWFARNNPTSLEIIDMADALPHCLSTLAEHHDRLALCPKLQKLFDQASQ